MQRDDDKMQDDEDDGDDPDMNFETRSKCQQPLAYVVYICNAFRFLHHCIFCFYLVIMEEMHFLLLVS